MDLELLFSLAGGLAMLGWALLLLAPRSVPTRRGVPVAIALLLALGYGALLAYALPRAEGGFGSLEEVGRLFALPEALLAGWIHYLAFDLFVGAWIVEDSLRQGMSRLLVAPVLVLTFLAGPVGLLLYHALRAARRRDVRLSLEGAPHA